MAIHWVGKIESDDINTYQTAELHKNSVEIKMPDSMTSMQLRAIPYLIPSLVILFLSMLLKSMSSGSRPINILSVFIGLVFGFALLLLHEWLHAIVYPSNANVYIGFMPKQFVAVALASYPLSRKRFCLMCLLPYILGIVPIILFCCFPSDWLIANGLLFGMAAVGLASPYPDAYNVFMVLKNAPSGSKIQFYQDKLFFFNDR